MTTDVDRSIETTEGGEPIVGRAQSFYYPGGPKGVVLVHGFAGTIDSLRGLALQLYGKGYSVYGLRLPGHGVSVEALERTNKDLWLRAVSQAINRLKTKCTDISVIGLSMGGNLALLSSLRRKDISKIVLISTPLKVRGQWWKRRALPVLSLFKRYHSKSWVKSDERQTHLETGSYLKVSLKAFASALKVFAETKHILSKITVPVLMVYAKRDVVIQPASAESIYQLLGSRHKELIWVNTDSHQPHASEKREAIFERINHFLSTTHGR